MEKNKVFLDSSVVIAAILSSQGGSFYVLETFCETVSFYINEYILTEVLEVLSRKFKNQKLETTLFLLLGLAKVNVLPNPRPKTVSSCIGIVEEKDAPVLAGAIEEDVHWLLSLDKPLLRSAKGKVPFDVCAPGEFIQRYQHS
jgi:putative PIN family toxin of toxin-antitoxin system